MITGDPFQDRLLTGERVQWQGHPAKGPVFAGPYLFVIPFSVVWIAFALNGILFNARAAPGPGQYLMAALFCGVGLYIGFGRFLTDWWLRQGTWYAVTNQRVLILEDGFTTRFIALPVDRLPALSLIEKSRGRGTIRFSDAPDWGRNGWSGASQVPQFQMIDNVRDVFDRIQKAARAA